VRLSHFINKLLLLLLLSFRNSKYETRQENDFALPIINSQLWHIITFAQNFNSSQPHKSEDISATVWLRCQSHRQGCKRDLIFRDRDVWKFVQDETDTFWDPYRDIFEVCRDRCLLLSFWLQTATNYAVFWIWIWISSRQGPWQGHHTVWLCVSFIYYAKHSSVSATVLQKFSCFFPKDCQQFD